MPTLQPTHRGADGAASTSHFGGTLEDCQEGWENWYSIFTIITMFPHTHPSPHTLFPSPAPISSWKESLIVEGGSGSFAVICPFPRLRSVPSGLCS